MIGASAGGVSAPQALVGALPPALQAAVLIVLHKPPDVPNALAQILARASPVPVQMDLNDAVTLPVRVYVAPPARHQMVEGNQVSLFSPLWENHFRPSIDVLFRSAALAYGRHAIGVVLTDTRDDGTSGFQAIRACGGLTITQDPDVAADPDRPKSAIKNVAINSKMSQSIMVSPLPEVPRC